MDFNEIFVYDESSPTCLRWKIDVYGGRNYQQLRVAVGDIAGSKSRRGHRVIYQKRSYSVHRIIWKMHYGEIPDKIQIDHENQNFYDNRLLNLRLATNRQNKQNSGKYKNNTSGVTGVRKLKMGHVWYWSATWAGLDCKRVSRYFSVDKYGEEVAFQMACERRLLEIENLNALGMSYTEIHGKELAQKL